jgi:hypothetical protein
MHEISHNPFFNIFLFTLLDSRISKIFENKFELHIPSLPVALSETICVISQIRLEINSGFPEFIIFSNIRNALGVRKKLEISGPLKPAVKFVKHQIISY